ncbi:MAG: DUF1893 domain-containing protein [Ruminococcus sp.]|nr:DUF1893 domain-containing protein [Ruminococcus sp.]
MKTDLLYAKSLLHNRGYTCVICKDGIVHTSTAHGVKPLLDLLESNIKVDGFYAADKVVGKATAFLYVLAGVCEIYADVMSESAKRVLDEYNIKCYCDNIVKAIRNRTDTGYCPMEQSVLDIDNPIEAKTAILQKLKELQK